MDIRGLLHFIAENFNLVAGTTLALFFLTSMILLVRSIGESKKESSGGGGGASIDLGAIEGAMKRVLATQPVSVVASTSSESRPSPVAIESSGGGDSGDSGDSELAERLRTDLNEREETIQNLKNEIENMKIQLQSAGDAVANPGRGGSSGDVNTAELEETRSKLEELQARLAEYEIIEDDIADLSIYKEENSKLQAELADLKAQLAAGGSRPSPVATSPAAPAPAPVAEPAPHFDPGLAAAIPMPDVQLPEDEPEAPEASEVPAANQESASLNFVKSDKFELDFNDDIMQEFASAVSLERAPAPDPSSSVSTSDSGVNLDNQTAIDMMMASVEAANAPAGQFVQEGPQASVDALLAASAIMIEPLAPEPVPQSSESEEPQIEEEAAVSNEALIGAPDTDKLLSEMAGLTPNSVEAEDALADSLDTDKLLAEMDSIKVADEPSLEAKTTAPPEAPAVAQPEAPTAAPAIKIEPLSLDDDLLAEFKDASGGDSNS